VSTLLPRRGHAPPLQRGFRPHCSLARLAGQRATFTKIEHFVEAAGGTTNDVIRVDIYVTDIKQREEVWKARRGFFTGDFPTSTLVEVRALATPQLLVEVNATGFVGGSS
jgi:enamine deaminase RidA (YjgF/YER057c/UK114 family)